MLGTTSVFKWELLTQTILNQYLINCVSSVCVSSVCVSSFPPTDLRNLRMRLDKNRYSFKKSFTKALKMLLQCNVRFQNDREQIKIRK